MAGHMDGYHRLAAIIGTNHELAIFRQFSILNAKNLLYMQGELIHLEAELRGIACEDKKSQDPEKAKFEFCIHTLRGPHDCEDGDEQWRKILEIRLKLKEYNKALHRFSKICTFEQANTSDLKVLREWLEREDGGHFFLRGYEKDTWSDVNEKDLVSISARYRDKDVFTKWINLYFIPFYHKMLGHRVRDRMTILEESSSESTLIPTPVYHYHDDTIRTIVNIFSTMLSSLLPLTSIFALYFIRTPLARLGSIVAFTVFFSAILAMIAKVRRVDSFAATTAFAAVQVVFVGSTNMTA